ncbi:DNA topoisomerase 1 [Sugiyamaella lignohabitans]|uniref:DNA topoisomerase I n=1 Tax=Sugiyamaella lignohabitans TaxID=796027 RepID=A0A167C2J8_9ASCO|nr:DNA topoisomerase 1 [Sugiyamaella lignohabitans]ANB11142.1 DNA topoisomerase 1 [Sugiyamaella lignohabitans]
MPEPIMMDSDMSDDDIPLVSRVASYVEVSDDDDDDDLVLAKRTTTATKRKAISVKTEVNGSPPTKKRASTTVKKEKTTTASKAKKASTATVNGKAKKEVTSKTNGRVKKETGSTASGKTKKEPGAGSKSATIKKEEEEEGTPAIDDEDQDETFRWWEAQNAEDGSDKWNTLEHNGVMFPPPYEPLPSHVRMKYDGKRVELDPVAEEVAGFFGAMLNTDHAKNPTFTANFFNDFVEIVNSSGGAKVNNKKIELKSFEKCDFTEIFEYYDQQRQLKKAIPSSEKKRLKAEKDRMEEKYKTCLLDGRKQPVGNFRIEPPGLFRGRGAHPKTGKLKARVQPEQVTINIGAEAKVPEPPAGHQWAEVRHDKTVSWLAMWRENINGAFKYVFLAQSSSLKGMSDFKKFEKARELKNHVERIRADYRRELKDEVMLNRQRATAMYLIDVLALRAGGEKGEDEADTVGCCSLRYEHVTLQPPNIVTFDFLGKDSIRYFQEVVVDKQVFKNLKIFKRAPKTIGDDIFDRLDPPLLNKHLQNYMPGLTAKVFRTYNASYTMQKQLDLIENKGSVNEKVVAFNAANREVAILCNHQRTVAKSHEASVGKMEDRILELKYSIIKTKKMMLQLDPSLKKKEKAYFEDIDSISKEDVIKIHQKILEREKDRIEKKFIRENEKLKAEGEEIMPEGELKKRLEAIDIMEKEFAAELKSGKPDIKGNATVEKLKVQVEKLEERITNTQLQLKDKEDNSTVALGTSKMNYIDPRLTVMFSKKFNVPIEKLFTKTLREKFAWAIHSADADWKF